MNPLWPAILLAWIAGCVDAFGYLALAHVFTAHMSGNTASLGAHLGQGNWHETLLRAMAIPAFVLGVALGTASEELARRLRLRAHLVPPFALEMVLLLCFIRLDPRPPGSSPPEATPRFFLLVWLLALAMGLQSATLRRAGGARVRTTYISGMLTNMAEEGTRYVLQVWEERATRKQARVVGPHRPFGARAVQFGLIVLAFLVGAICGGYGETRWGAAVLLAPVAGLFLLLIEDCLAPEHFRNSTLEHSR